MLEHMWEGVFIEQEFIKIKNTTEIDAPIKEIII